MVSSRSLTSSSMTSSTNSRSSSSSEEMGSPRSPRVKASATEKFIDLKVAAEEKMTKASARLSEKVVLVRTNLALGLYRIIRHEQSPRHDKCLDHVAETQTAATERRLRKEQQARERAEWERAMAREWSAYKSSRHLEHRRSSSAHKHLQSESRSHQQLLQGAA
ncbi:hypothetical protein M758_3G128900 [Ceratodon purpureus]|nr:hypothetical protein M758_3G128900 [Ceratodon purpureus]